MQYIFDLYCAGVRLLANYACICPEGLFAVAGSANCSSCHYSCATCVSSYPMFFLQLFTAQILDGYLLFLYGKLL